MTIRTLGVAGVGAMGLAAIGLASPAAAAVVPGCGEVPAGASATVTGGVCQLDFTTPGAYSWTLPAGISGLYALLVGGGGGAKANSVDIGYAGSGGSVVYADYTTAQGGNVATLTVGAAGQSGFPAGTGGGASSMMLGVSGVAPGGAAGNDNAPYCIAKGDLSTYVSAGDGAGGAEGPDGADCATTFGPGVNPSLGNLDSDGNAVPARFASLAATFGTGGQVVVAPIALPSGLAGTGWGASVQYVSPGSVPSFDSEGGSGRISYRYTVPAALPATGLSAMPQVIVAGAAGLLGAAMFAFARRRTRAQS